MCSFLKNHPFAVEAFFESSLVLTFAIPKDQLEKFIPDCLSLDTFNDKWAFMAIAMVQTKHLRPKGFPAFVGNSFFLIGYRIFVRYVNLEGKRLRGLYILKSETDKRKMQFLGNLFTQYNYQTTDIKQTTQGSKTEIKSLQSDFVFSLENTNEDNVFLPAHSPFVSWKEARRFAGPLPYTFSFDASQNKVLIVEGVRQNWKPRPVQINHCYFSFINTLKFSEVVLANAFVINNIPYYWKKEKIEPWHS
jgi:hypothetical protein